MTTTSTTGLGNLGTTGGTSVLQTRSASYGENPFLELLTTQLRNQTPLEPVDNESFMNQMASYTTMQESREMNSNLLKLLDYQGVLARVQGLSQGSALLGKEVSYAGEDGQEARAKVESIYVAESGDVRLKLAGGKEIDLRQVLGIAEASATTGSTTEPSGTGTGEGETEGSTESSTSSATA